MSRVVIAIPARFGASRLPGKPLRLIAGSPLIAHVIARAQSVGQVRVVVATDDMRIAEVAERAGVEACLTSPEHRSGSDRLAECAERLGVGRRIRFAGSVSDAEKYSLLAISDIFASTSQHEGFGLVFLEAMACGLPVVCHDRGGQTDFLRDGETGRLTGVGDHDGFVEALRKLAESPDERRRMGGRNREIVESYFIEHCARSYEELFEKVLAGRESVADRDRFTSID